MRTILLPVDGSISSQFAASHVGSRIGDGETLDVRLLNVQYRPHAHLGLSRIVTRSMIDDYVEQLGNEALAPAAAVLKEFGIAYQTELAFGDPGQVIANLAATHAYDEIVMGTRGVSVLAGLFVGSVAMKVVQLVAVPVTLVTVPFLTFHREGQTTPERVVAPDVAPGTRKSTLLALDGSAYADRAVEFVLAEARRGIVNNIVLLNVQRAAPAGGFWDAIAPEVITEDDREEGLQCLQSATQRLEAAGLQVAQEVRFGSAAETIAAVIKEFACHRLVIGTRGMGALENLLLGSTARRVLHLVEVPVVLVK